MNIPPNTHPIDIFKYLADKEAAIKWAQNYKPQPIPKVHIPKVKSSAGMKNFFKALLP